MTTATIPRHISEFTAPAKVRGAFAPPQEPNRAQRQARPRLDDLEITHPDLRAVIAGVRKWGAALNETRRQQNTLDDGAPLRPPSLILSGPNGTGKTQIARVIQWSLVNEALDEDGRPLRDMVSPACRWYAAADLLARLGNEKDSDGYSYSGAPGRMAGGAPFVIVDDVAAELSIPFVAYPAQEAERQIRYHLFFNWCVENRVPVILTTNLAAAGPQSDLANHVGPRAWSRLMQMVPVGFILSLWNVPDYRIKVGGR